MTMVYRDGLEAWPSRGGRSAWMSSAQGKAARRVMAKAHQKAVSNAPASAAGVEGWPAAAMEALQYHGEDGGADRCADSLEDADLG